ncbi:nucleoside hydrolase [Lentzea sp. NBRC 105346]|uniref:nucleoside hydrolase n=1 Tax=Lentzea sp. NBRC 105346 TaxID=3032205 RepID=UPI0024A096D9|nr:nucleoside hydrolase [Lentzea sp. NBRC 105346]GLZ34421.1 nucleoside hydrolase [Lentzea sp. NBRC 105346]
MRIIVDTDPGVDDALALFNLAASPEAEIVAIGTVHGNVPAPQATANTLRLLELLGLTHIPVAGGAQRPLAQPLMTAESVHGDDGLGGFAGPEPVTRPTNESAAEQIVRLARANPGELTLLALGPLTNVALALQLEPELPKLLERIVVMGGALNAPGNITSYAEANFWHDPEAADHVLGAGFPDLTVVGLDVTMEAHADDRWLARLAALNNPIAAYATSIVGFYAAFYESFLGKPGFVPHDSLAVAIMLDPDLATYREERFAIELTGRHTRGQLVADLRYLAPGSPFDRDIAKDRTPAKYAVTVDTERFLDWMIDTLTVAEP